MDEGEIIVLFIDEFDWVDEEFEVYLFEVFLDF